MLGGQNIFSDLKVKYSQVGQESFLLRKPQVIIEFKFKEPWSAQKDSLNRLEWQPLKEIPAIKQGNIFVLTGDHTLIPGPRIYRLARDYLQIFKKLNGNEWTVLLADYKAKSVKKGIRLFLSDYADWRKNLILQSLFAGRNLLMIFKRINRNAYNTLYQLLEILLLFKWRRWTDSYSLSKRRKMGKFSKKEIIIKPFHQIEDIQFINDLFKIKIDGKVYTFKLSEISKKRAQASPSERENFKISPSGYGIHWPAI